MRGLWFILILLICIAVGVIMFPRSQYRGPSEIITTMSIPEGIRSAGLTARESDIMRLIKPSIRASVKITEDKNLAIGTSKLGGMPDLPTGFVWPKANGTCLSFIAQLNMGDLKQYDIEKLLPQKGMLYFFYNNDQQTWGFDPADRGNWQVAYSDIKNSELVRIAFPEELEPEGRFKSGGLSFSKEDTLPGWESLWIEELNLNDDESDRYVELTDQVNYRDKETIYRLLGHPQEIQGEMQLECQLVTHGMYCGDPTGYQDPRRKELEPGAKKWQLLFQVDSDDDLGMMWGDVGRLYFWIPEESLKKCDFDKVWLILQCT